MNPIRSSGPEKGLLLIQVDGLSHAHLRQALDRGLMPNLQQALESGQFESSDFHSGVPSHTGVVEAGVLYGRSTLPSNQWLDKETGGLMNVTGSHTSDLIEDAFLESGAHGLIEGGSAFLTALPGNADESHFVLTEVARARRLGGRGEMIKELAGSWANLGWHLAIHPLQAVRTVGRFAFEAVRGIFERRRDDIPQRFVEDRLKPAVWSAVQNVVLTDGCVQAMRARVKAGDPAIFIDLPAFDDIGHAFGPQRAMRTLKSIDENIGTLMRAAEKSARPYNVVLYGDHGQTECVSFRETYGQTLGDWVKSLLPPLSEPAGDPSGQCPTEIEPRLPQVIPADVECDPRFTVLDFGPGAHLYFRSSTAALNGPEIEAAHPGLMAQIAAHPAVGFLVTRDGSATEMVGARGRVRVEGSHVTVCGENPLEPYGNADVTVWQLHDQAHREGAGDVLIFGGFAGDKIVNFSLHPQGGTHGGIGNTQDVPFLIQPAGLGLDMRNVDQASELYTQLRAHLPSDSPAALS